MGLWYIFDHQREASCEVEYASLVLLEQDRYSDVFVCVKTPFPLMEFDMHTSFADRRTLLVNMLGSPATCGSIYKHLI